MKAAKEYWLHVDSFSSKEYRCERDSRARLHVLVDGDTETTKTYNIMSADKTFFFRSVPPPGRGWIKGEVIGHSTSWHRKRICGHEQA